MAKRVGDLLAWGIFLLSIFIFFQALKTTGVLMIIGLIGAIILFIVEGYYLLNWLRRKYG